jgi:epoxyqueuosine reductase
MMDCSDQISDSVKNKAEELGFLACAVLSVDFLSEEQPHFEKWLNQDFYGEMGYMVRNSDKRLDPRLLVENARTMIIVLQNYFPEEIQHDPEAPVLSKYAYGRDYHLVLKGKLNKLLAFIQKEIPSCNGRAFVDSAPVLERAWARRAGLGWVGKNSNLISPDHGSFFFIGEIILDAELPYDQPEPVRDRCGTCTRCLDACPTRAIVADRVVDARRCISYQTIELKGNLDASQKGTFENRVFGCDICQDVCPWNSKSNPHSEPEFYPNPKLLSLTKDDWYSMKQEQYSEIFSGSAIERTGFSGLKRNLEFLKPHADE